MGGIGRCRTALVRGRGPAFPRRATRRAMRLRNCVCNASVLPGKKGEQGEEEEMVEQKRSHILQVRILCC